MARQYSPKTFIRGVPIDLLQQYFEGKGFTLGIDWDSVEDSDADPLFDAIQALTDRQRATVESDFTEINELAEEKGTQSILEEATIRGEDWFAQFEALENHYARAFWTFLNESECFEVAGAFHQMDRFRSWWRRFVGKRLEPKTNLKAVNKFSEELKSIYRPQGRGRFCKVDTYQRLKPVRWCYFAYPEDMATSDIGYADDGQFNRRPRRSALEIIFVYRPKNGVVEVHAAGNKQLKEDLARAFCVTILGLQGLPDDGEVTPYDLNGLKNSDFPFTTTPADNIESVELKLLRLDLPIAPDKGTGRRITIAVSSLRSSPNALYTLLSDAINLNCIDFDDVLLAQAKFTIVFRAIGSRRKKRLTFEVSYPDRCTLKDDPYDQIARRCLKRWGIARD
ncbi:MAG: hypothetical protein KDA54_05910 [Phycisphaerales bacterium]|nr:hypothetical protein [Phycisphaerales bacterium]